MPIIGTLPNNIQDGQVADAVPVMADFNFIVNQVNANAQPLNTPQAGTLLNIQVSQVSGTYTATVGTNSVIVVLVGGGGAGGGSTATNAGQISVGAGGNSGAMAIGRLVSGFSGQSYTIGAGGTPTTGGGGGNGGASTFLTLTAPGGAGGNLSSAVVTSSTAAASPTGTGSNATGGFLGTGPALGGTSLFVQNQAALVGVGGDSPLGGGGGNGVFQGLGGNGRTAGAGGGGCANGPSQGSIAGGAGFAGIIIFYEYS
jgi:hypothetical protein